MATITPSDKIITATLTKLGRELLMTQNERFLITSFAVADPEVNYNLIDSNDADYSIIDSFSVFETTDPEVIQQNLLIRKVDNIEDIVKAQQQPIPSTEIQVVTKLDGTSTLSLGSWQNDELTVSFGLQDPITNSYFLSSGFLIDFTEFWSGFGLYFNFVPVSPQAALTQVNQYWYIATSSSGTPSGPLVVGIDDTHKPSNGKSLANYTNSISIPALTFSISLPSELLKPIYNFMIGTNQTQLTGNIKISNNDNTILPLTTFYGNGAQYYNISTKIPVTIVF